MKKLTFSILAAGLAAAALVHGYNVEPNGLRWGAGPLSLHSYLDTVDAQRAVSAAIRAWQEPLSDLLQIDAVAGRGEVAIGNEMSEIGWEAMPPEVVSLTRIVSRDGRILEADVSVSPEAAAGATWSLDSILTHELGHAIGLGHADDGGQAVNAAMSADPRATSATLTRDDLAGLIQAYRPDDAVARVGGDIRPRTLRFRPARSRSRSGSNWRRPIATCCGGARPRASSTSRAPSSGFRNTCGIASTDAPMSMPPTA